MDADLRALERFAYVLYGAHYTGVIHPNGSKDGDYGRNSVR